MKFDLGFRSQYLLTMKNREGTVFQDYFVGIVGSEIASVEPYQDSLKNNCAEFIDATGKILMPGLINAHAHQPMSLFRGYYDDVPFHSWLFDHVFPAEATLVNERFVRTGASLSALESIRFGTTTVNDMYFHTEVAAEVMDQSGMRGYSSWHITDFLAADEIRRDKDLKETDYQKRLEPFRQFYERYKNHPRVRVALGPHAPYTCSDALLKAVVELAKELNVPIHMHVSETAKEVQDSVAQHGKTPGFRLDALGALDVPFFAAHCVHLTDLEIKLFLEKGVSVLYNPDSNLKLGSGVAPIAKLLAHGLKVAIGTDGAGSNNDLSLFGAMDIGTKAQKLANANNTAMVALDALRLATIDGARALGLDHLVGSIEVGKKADLILVDTNFPHMQPMNSVLSQLVYSCQGLEVDSVWCNGHALMRNRIHQTLNAEEIYKEVSQFKGLLLK